MGSPSLSDSPLAARLSFAARLIGRLAAKVSSGLWGPRSTLAVSSQRAQIRTQNAGHNRSRGPLTNGGKLGAHKHSSRPTPEPRLAAPRPPTVGSASRPPQSGHYARFTPTPHSAKGCLAAHSTWGQVVLPVEIHCLPESRVASRHGRRQVCCYYSPMSRP